MIVKRVKFEIASLMHALGSNQTCSANFASAEKRRQGCAVAYLPDLITYFTLRKALARVLRWPVERMATFRKSTSFRVMMDVPTTF